MPKELPPDCVMAGRGSGRAAAIRPPLAHCAPYHSARARLVAPFRVQGGPGLSDPQDGVAVVVSMTRAIATGALVVALVVQGAYAGPARALAQVRALACCAHCHH